ncbi:MAG: DUF456 family protein [Phycisphaera sp.]|nr:DUF456 family protein [Phycisphaera sp.]
MWDFLQTGGVWVTLGVLILVNAAGVGLVVFQLPGTWLIVLATACVSFFIHDTISVTTLVVLALLAIGGEVVEFIAGARGAAKAGGARRSAVLAIAVGLIGSVLGTVFIPVPVLGTIVGGCLGAGVGSVMGEKWKGRSWQQARAVGRGAAIGRFWGTVLKITIACVMWAIATVAVFWP